MIIDTSAFALVSFCVGKGGNKKERTTPNPDSPSQFLSLFLGRTAAVIAAALFRFTGKSCILNVKETKKIKRNIKSKKKGIKK